MNDARYPVAPAGDTSSSQDESWVRAMEKNDNDQSVENTKYCQRALRIHEAQPGYGHGAEEESSPQQLASCLKVIRLCMAEVELKQILVYRPQALNHALPPWAR